MLKLKLQYFGHLMWRADSLEKILIMGNIGGQEEKGMTENEMVGWHHWLNGHGFGWTLGVGDGQGGLACCSHVVAKSRTQLSDWTELNWTTTFIYLFFPFIFISWGLITSQHFSGFCHTLTWISHGVTCIPRPDPASHLPLHPVPLGLPSAPGPSTCLMHPTWAGDLFHYR